ncbi:MAG: ATP-binding cassette domain-containing protein, partial [Sphaerochaetaceae bacterium]|nr:ATP-binding cassette domain-containing protein [Sphaerochaetaceae bacterium]
MSDKKVLLSLKNVSVKFNVRGRILSAIRNVSLDIYENESIAIVGESGSGKSVLTKTFAGMLDSNGFISEGSIIFSDDEISKTSVVMDKVNIKILNWCTNMLNKCSTLERGSVEYNAYLEKKKAISQSASLSEEENEELNKAIKELEDNIIDRKNHILTLDKRVSEDAVMIKDDLGKIALWNQEKAKLLKEAKEKKKGRKTAYYSNKEKVEEDKKVLSELLSKSKEKIGISEKEGNAFGLADAVIERNSRIAKEILLSIGRYPRRTQVVFLYKLKKAFEKALRC